MMKRFHSSLIVLLGIIVWQVSWPFRTCRGPGSSGHQSFHEEIWCYPDGLAFICDLIVLAAFNILYFLWSFSFSLLCDTESFLITLSSKCSVYLLYFNSHLCSQIFSIFFYDFVENAWAFNLFFFLFSFLCTYLQIQSFYNVLDFTDVLFMDCFIVNILIN